MSENITYKTLLKNKNFMKIFLSNIISRFGDAIDTIAYGYMVYELTGSAVLLATLFAVNGIPSLLFNIVSGIVVNYMPKKPIMVVCDIGRGLVVIITGALYFFGGLQVWHLFAFTVLNSTFEAFRRPASGSFFIQLIKKEEYELATSLRSSGEMMSELIGYGAAGAIIGLLGIGGAIILDGITFILCGLLILLVVFKGEYVAEDKLTFAQAIKDVKEGFTYVFSNKTIRTTTLFAGGLMFFLVPFNALQTVYVLDVLKLDVTGLSVLSISILLAIVIGSITAPMIRKATSSRLMLTMGGILFSICYFAFGFLESVKGSPLIFIYMAIIAFVFGLSFSMVNLPIQLSFRNHVDVKMITRALSIINVLTLSSAPIGGAIVGALVNHFSIPTLFFAFSTLLLILFVSQYSNPVFIDDSIPEVNEAS